MEGNESVILNESLQFCLWEQRRKASLMRLQRKELPELAGPNLILGFGCCPQSHSWFATEPGSKSSCLDSLSSAPAIMLHPTDCRGWVLGTEQTSPSKTPCSLYSMVLTTSSATGSLPVSPTLLPQHGIKQKYLEITHFNRLHPASHLIDFQCLVGTVGKMKIVLRGTL